MQFWLVKQEPEDYAWADLVRERQTAWTGVRNFQARNSLKEMRGGDLVLFYHSGGDKSVVGIAKVLHEAYPDPTAKEGDWVAVDLAPVQELKEAVSLPRIKAEVRLKDIPLVRQSRLSVMPLERAAFVHILKLGKTPMP